MKTVNIWAEVVPKRTWPWIGIGRVWKHYPTEHAGRLINIQVELPDGFLSTPQFKARIDV